MENQELAKQWEDIIKKYESTGLSKAEYCRQNRIIYHRYMYWQKRIREENKSGFLPIRVSSSTQITQIEQSIHDSNHGIIKYPSGLILQIRSKELLKMVPKLVAIKQK